jgi:formate dehydrogenase major subunit
MDEIAALTPTFAGVSVRALDRRGRQRAVAVQRGHPTGTPIMHVDGFVRGKGRFVSRVRADRREDRPRFPLLLTTGRILSQYNVGAQTRRTANSRWHEEDRLEIHPHDAEERGIRDGDWVAPASRAGETTLRADVTDRVRPAWSTPPSTTRRRGPTSSPPTFRLGHQLPGIQGDGGAGLPCLPCAYGPLL